MPFRLLLVIFSLTLVILRPFRIGSLHRDARPCRQAQDQQYDEFSPHNPLRFPVCHSASSFLFTPHIPLCRSPSRNSYLGCTNTNPRLSPGYGYTMVSSPVSRQLPTNHNAPPCPNPDEPHTPCSRPVPASHPPSRQTFRCHNTNPTTKYRQKEPFDPTP